MAVDDSPLSLPAGSEPPAGGDSGADPGAQPAGTPDAPDGGQAARGADLVGKIVAQAVAPFIQSVDSRMQALEQQRSQPAPAPKVESTDDELSRFVTNPAAYRAAIAEETAKQVLQQLHPVLSGTINATREGAIASEKARIDTKYGPGTYDEVLKPHLDSAAQQAPAINYDPRALKTAVAALVGSADMEATLDQRRSAHQAKQAEAAKQAKERTRQAPPSFLGSPRGLLDQEGRATITPEDQAILAGLERAGIGISEAEWKAGKSTTRGADLDTQLAEYEKALGTKQKVA